MDAEGVKPGDEASLFKADGTLKEPAAEPVVPEAYEFTMPEGMTLDKAAAEEFSTIAKAHKLTQEDASKFVGIAIQMQTRARDAHIATVAEWAETVKADKEIGGDKLPATLANTKRVMDSFGSPALKEALNQSGYGNHPEFIKFVNKIGSLISEDNFVAGGNTTPSGTVESRMFPTMKQA